MSELAKLAIALAGSTDSGIALSVQPFLQIDPRGNAMGNHTSNHTDDIAEHQTGNPPSALNVSAHLLLYACSGFSQQISEGSCNLISMFPLDSKAFQSVKCKVLALLLWHLSLATHT